MHACGLRDESAAEASLDVGFGFVAGSRYESSTVAHEEKCVDVSGLGGGK